MNSFKIIPDELTYATGAEFWAANAGKHGQQEALVIGRNFLNDHMRDESHEMRQFCRELFAAMYETTASIADPNKIVYPYDFETADKRLEASYYYASSQRNSECARAIDAAISASYYKTDHYNLEGAAQRVIMEYGLERVSMLLAHHIQEHDYDGRFSAAHKIWAQSIDVPAKSFKNAIPNSHATLIDGIVNYASQMYINLRADRFALPGQPESGEIVHGYEVTRSIFFDDQRGFAIAYDPDAPDSFVCWQFTVESNNRDFYWGCYGDAKAASDSYLARIAVHMSGGDIREIPNPLKAAEVNVDQDHAVVCEQVNGDSLLNCRPTDVSGISATMPEAHTPTDAEREFAMWRTVTESRRKHITFLAPGQKQPTRCDTLRGDYTEQAIRERIAGRLVVSAPAGMVPMIPERTPTEKPGLLVDIESKMREGKGAAYQRWAKVHNLKQMAKTIIYLQEKGLDDYDVLRDKASATTARFNDLSSRIRELDDKLAANAALQKNIVTYSKTRSVYAEYKKSRWSKAYKSTHEADILLHQAAKKAFDDLGYGRDKKLPTVASLRSEYALALEEKKKAYREYQQAKTEMQELLTAKSNVDRLLNISGGHAEHENERAEL